MATSPKSPGDQTAVIGLVAGVGTPGGYRNVPSALNMRSWMISGHFCRLMGGDLTVESIHREGSTFTVRLPAVVKEPDAALTR